jgi:phage-related tail fiber protein
MFGYFYLIINGVNYRFVGLYNNTKTYLENDFVKFDSKYYGCLAEATGISVSDTNFWVELDLSTSSGGDGDGVATISFSKFKVDGKSEEAIADQIDDTLTIIEGTGMSINIDPANDTIRFTVTGEATPAAHATDHLSDGSDPIPNATEIKNGLMSPEFVIKLNTVETNANYYIHPLTHSATIIVQNSTHRFVTDAQISSWNAKIDGSVYTANDVLSKLLTVDGSGSNLDADRLDGQEGSYYAPASHIGTGNLAHAAVTTTVNGFMIFTDKLKLDNIANEANKTSQSSTNGNILINGSEVIVYIHPLTHPATMITEDSTHRFVTDAQISSWNSKLDSTSYTASDVLSKLLTVDGTGSLLDADKLDGHDSTYFTPASHIGSGDNAHSLATTLVHGFMSSTDKLKLNSVSSGAKNVASSTTNGNILIDTVETIVYTHPLTHPATMIITDSTHRFVTDSQISSWSAKLDATSYTASDVLAKLLTVDGSGSNLDADLLDGYNSTYYTNIPARLGYTPVNKAGDTMTGYLFLYNNPTSELHAATKAYVDAVAQGLNPKASVRIATTEDIELTGLQTIDDVSVLENNRILVKDQTDKTQNGIYLAKTTNWIRSSDANENSEVVKGISTYVTEGTSNGGTAWILITPNPINLGLTELTFTQFSGSPTTVAGIGLDKLGNVIFLTNTGVTAGTYTKVTVDLQGRITSASNPTTLDGYGITDATPTSHIGTGGSSHAQVTTLVDGFMIASDKSKLNNIAANATKTSVSLTNGNILINDVETTVYVHPSSHPASMIDQDSNYRFVTDAQISSWNAKLDATSYTASDVLAKLLTVDGAGSNLDADKLDGHDSTYFTPASHIGSGNGAHAQVTTTIDGFMIASDKLKLNNIASNATKTSLSVTNGNILINDVEATVYIHPLTHPASMITEDSTRRFVTDIEKSYWNNKLDSSSYTANDILSKLLTVDGTGSLLDSDFLDGQSSAYYTDIPGRLGYTPINKAGDTMVGFLTLHANPTANYHAVTKLYVDTKLQGLDTKDSVRVATFEPITLSGLYILDNVTLVEGDRVLVKDQANAYQNGIYTASSGSWTRSSDANTNEKITSGLYVYVEEGYTNGKSGWTLSTPNPIVLDVTELIFTQFNSVGETLPGTGLDKTGNVIFLTDTGVLAGAYTKVTVNLQGRITAASNPTTLAGYGILDAAPLSHVGTNGTSHAVVTTGVNGFMIAADKVKLNGISANAKNVASSLNNGNILIDGSEVTVYTHPATHPASMIDQSSSYRFVTDIEKSYWNAKLDASIYTANDVLAKLLTVDGIGSLLDSDLLDGQQGSYYLSRSNHTGTQSADTLTNGTTNKVFTVTNLNDLTQLLTNMNLQKEPTGFPNRTDTTLSFNNSNRNFTITGTNFLVFFEGKSYTKNTEVIAIPNIPGLHYIYYNSSLVLTVSQSSWDLSSVVPISTVYWDGIGGRIGDERHGITMDYSTHEYLHLTSGARFASGFNGIFDVSSFSISSGVYFDEDIKHVISSQTQARVYYKSGSVYTWTAKQSLFFYLNGGNIYWDSPVAISPVPSGQFVAYWIFATNDPETPIASIMGQRVDTSLATARINNRLDDLNLLDLPAKEYKILYRVILSSAPNNVEDIEDLRTVSIPSSGIFTSMSHSTLLDLDKDDHLQYLLLGTSRDEQTILSDLILDSANPLILNYSNANTVPIINATKELDSSTITTTELGYLANVTSNIQTQLNSKLPSASYTANDVLAKLLTVDGPGSLLDADTLDGQQGSWYAPASHIGTGGTSHAQVTITTDGFMIAADKVKLNGISNNAKNVASSTTNGNILIDGSEVTVYTHPLTHPATMIVQDANHRFVTDIEKSYWNAKLDASIYTANDVLSKLLTVDGPGSLLDADTLDGQQGSWYAPASHIGTGGSSHAQVTTLVDGFMIASDKVKLNGISANAKNVASSTTNGNILIDTVETIVYTHPATHPATMIVEDADHRFITDIERTAWNNKTDKITAGVLNNIVTISTGGNIQDSGKAFNDAGTTVNDILSASQVLSHIENPPAMSKVEVFRSNNQATTTATWTKVLFNAEVLDRFNEFDSTTNNRFTAIKAGRYLVEAIVSITHNDGGTRQIRLYRDGVAQPFIRIEEANTQSNTVSNHLFSSVIDLNAGQFIELYFFQNAGVNLNIVGTDTRMFITRLG